MKITLTVYLKMSESTRQLLKISAELLTQAINRKKADEVEAAYEEYLNWRQQYKQEKKEYREQKQQEATQ